MEAVHGPCSDCKQVKNVYHRTPLETCLKLLLKIPLLYVLIYSGIFSTFSCTSSTFCLVREYFSRQVRCTSPVLRLYVAIVRVMSLPASQVVMAPPAVLRLDPCQNMLTTFNDNHNDCGYPSVFYSHLGYWAQTNFGL